MIRSAIRAWVAWALGIAALSLFLTACGGDENGSGASTAAAGTCGPAGSRIASISRDNQRSFESPPAMIIDSSKSYEALIKTNKGDITIDLKAADAPVTVNNFIFLACTGYYDGLIFHRVELLPAPFVVQGGDPRGDGSGGPGYSVVEAPPKDLLYEKGVVAMAKTGTEPAGTSGSQFFVVTAEDAQLPPDYALLGKVTAGQEVVDKIGVVEIDPATEQPVEPVVIRSVEVSER